MRMLQVARAVAWIGAIIVWWSMNLVWGPDADAGKGPPGQWQRQVVGAGLLGLIAAISLMASGRGGKPPSWVARGITGACAAGMVIITLLLRSDAMRDFPHLLAGAGWTWLLAGSGFVLSAATLSFGLKPADDKKPTPPGKRRKKRRK